MRLGAPRVLELQHAVKHFLLRSNRAAAAAAAAATAAAAASVARDLDRTHRIQRNAPIYVAVTRLLLWLKEMVVVMVEVVAREFQPLDFPNGQLGMNGFEEIQGKSAGSNFLRADDDRKCPGRIRSRRRITESIGLAENAGAPSLL